MHSISTSRSFCLLHALCLLTLAAACTEEPASTGVSPDQDVDQGVDQGREDQGKSTPDMMTSADLGSPVDMPVDSGSVSDMPADLDMLPAQDMPADLGPEDLGPVDMGPADMGMPEDMLMYPDADVFPCAHPAAPGSNCPTGPYGPASFITTFTIVEDRTCCRDFDGDGDIENFIGDTLIKTARQNFGVNVNQNIANAINSGELAFIFEFESWENDQFDPMIKARILNGEDTMPTIFDNTQGVGAFYPLPASYDVMGDPLWEFGSASVHSGNFKAIDGKLRIYFPGIVDAVQINLDDVQVKARISPGADLAAGGGVTMLDGELSGAIIREDFFDSLNTFAQSCSCIGTPIFEKKTNGSYDCLLTSDMCVMSTDNACRLTGQQSFCVGLGLFSSSVDVDVSGDGKRDAFGFGARFSAVTTTLEERP